MRALDKQRRGGKSIKDTDRVDAALKKQQGLTATQLAWVATGFELDRQGHCIPRDLFNQMQAFSNYKRRINEATFAESELGNHPRARFKAGKAIRNPYDNAARGVYLLQQSLAVRIEYTIANKHDDVNETEPSTKTNDENWEDVLAMVT